MNQHRTRILGRAWHDLGSDVNWPENGGCWGRPSSEDPEVWHVIRLDAGYDNHPPVAVAVTVDTRKVDDGPRNYAEIPDDGLDEHGDPIPSVELRASLAAAYVHYWGAQGDAGGEQFSHGDGRIARARAARFLVG